MAKTTTEQANAHRVLCAIAGIFNSGERGATWQPSKLTIERLKESPRDAEQWAEIIDLDTGAELSAQTTHEPGRVIFTAHYQKDWEPYIEAERRRVSRHSITVSGTKTAEQMARDIARRLFEANNYWTNLATMREQKAKHDRKQAAAEATATDLRNIFGTKPRRSSSSYSEPSPDDKRKFHTVYVHGVENISLDGVVSHHGGTVDLKIDNLSPEQARIICQQVRDWNALRVIEADSK